MFADFATRLPTTAIAFRGYNQRNLGKTPELFAVDAYRPLVERRLVEASDLCARLTDRPVDLVARVAARSEAGVDHYAEAIALVFAAELAQVDLLREVHGIQVNDARLAFGYSLGELVALMVAGLYPAEEVMTVPLTLAADCAAMAAETTMAVVFSRAAVIDPAIIERLCEDLTAEGGDAVAVSAILSPNTLLAIGEGRAIDRLRQRCDALPGSPILVRSNDGVWPPLHTPLVCKRNIRDRATLMIRQTPRLIESPPLPIVSLVTGKREYESGAGREVLRRWVDSPQRLWEVVEHVLASDVQTVLHIGPEPNVIPATFLRLADNVVRQTLAWSLTGVGLRTVQRMATSTWLAPLLPRRGSLLRAPMIDHVIAEDWLLEHAPR